MLEIVIIVIILIAASQLRLTAHHKIRGWLLLNSEICLIYQINWSPQFKGTLLGSWPGFGLRQSCGVRVSKVSFVASPSKQSDCSTSISKNTNT